MMAFYGGVKMDATANLSGQQEIKDLFDVMERNGLKREKREIETLISYLENMESQFGKMLEELVEVRGQLAQIQDKGIRATVSHIIGGAEKRVHAINTQITLIKSKLISSAKNAVKVCKENGVEATRKVIYAMKIPNALLGLKELFHSGMESMNRKAAKIGIISGELHKASAHVKNAGRILIGKQRREVAERQSDKGVLAKVQKVLSFCGQTFYTMEKNTESVMKRMEREVKNQESKPSVKKELNDIKYKKKNGQEKEHSVYEKSR